MFQLSHPGQIGARVFALAGADKTPTAAQVVRGRWLRIR